ncbi:MarR family transcriptional regulator [bacterium 210820-DFI.6.37]|nr:MarR family transcriptional regulator [bacterium 210820-DFI.6.37]
MQNMGKLIHTVDVKLKRKIDRLAFDYDLTSVQFVVMELIYLTPKDQDIFQKDLEAALDVRRSTISNILGLLEKKDYVRRESVRSDARLKKLALTPAGEAMYLEFKSCLAAAEAEDFQLFSEDEKRTLLCLLERLSASIH